MRLLVCLVFLAAACGPQARTANAETRAEVEVTEGWAAPTPNGVTVSAGYLTIANSSDTTDTLVAVTSPRAERVEVHEMTHDGGIMRMRAVQTLALSPGETVALEPGGRHLMFYGVTQPFAVGETIVVTLTFEHAGDIPVTLSVRNRTAHSGH